MGNQIAVSIVLYFLTILTIVSLHEVTSNRSIEEGFIEPIKKTEFPFREPHTCYPMIGCTTNQIGYGVRASDPVSLDTAFAIWTHSDVLRVNYGKDGDDTYPYDLDKLRESTFNISRDTVIIITGFMARAENAWQVEMKNRWLKLRPDINVIIVSWPGGNFNLYAPAIFNTRIVARQISALLYYLAKVNGVDPFEQKFLEHFTLVGHSLGAHISGFVGKDFKGEIGRIIGLDPAGPLFSNIADPELKLDQSDAKLVQILHTNGGSHPLRFGHREPMGHIDFYVNGGKSQPGCSNFPTISKNKSACSHKRAPHLLLDFLATEYELKVKNRTSKLLAFRAGSDDDFRRLSTLKRFCPRFMLDWTGPEGSDLDRCAIPMDFVSRFDKVRERLQENHYINFDSDMRPERKFYFDTHAESPFLDNHFMLKFTFDRKTNETTAYNIKVELKGTQDNTKTISIRDHSVTGGADSPIIAAPYLGFRSAELGVHEIDELENQYLRNESAFSYDGYEFIGSIFPLSIKIVRWQNVDASMWQRDQVVESLFGSVVSVTIQPMAKSNRLYVASYKCGPEPIIIKRETLKTDKFTPEPMPGICSSSEDGNIVLTIDKISIGPKRGSASDSDSRNRT